MSDTQNEAAAPAVVAPAAPDVSAPAEMPIPFKVFAGLLAKTDDAVFTLLLKNRHGAEKATLSQWQAKLRKLHAEPAF